MAFDAPQTYTNSLLLNQAHQKPSPAGEHISGHRCVALTRKGTTITRSRALR